MRKARRPTRGYPLWIRTSLPVRLTPPHSRRLPEGLPSASASSSRLGFTWARDPSGDGSEPYLGVFVWTRRVASLLSEFVFAATEKKEMAKKTAGF